jgi:hypothetical protein
MQSAALAVAGASGVFNRRRLPDDPRQRHSSIRHPSAIRLATGD